MSWNIFSPVKRVKKRGKARDDFDELIDIIETFAPRAFLGEREAFYYNYKMMSSCKKSLLTLLETVSRIKRLKTDPSDHTCELFLKLKEFYDPRGKLSLAQALGDRNLNRRFEDLFVFFYGRQNLSRKEIAGWLEKLPIDSPRKR